VEDRHVLTHELVQAQLADSLGRPVRVLDVVQRRSVYSTSFALDDLVVTLGDGEELRLVVKDLSWESLLPEARRTKPRFLFDPRREVGVYTALLDPLELGTARCYGVITDETTVRSFLVLEKVPAVELYQLGELGEWRRVARWLARFHHLQRDRLAALEDSDVPLIRYDADFYRMWPARAERARRDPLLARLVKRYDAVIERLVASCRTLIHGELYASNVLVGSGRVCPIDWEMAGIGPALLDLAALTTGSGLSTADRRELVDAYREDDPYVGDNAEFLADLDACRIHLAMQWLGWSDHWVPPREHAHDWLREAVEAAERLGL
jgi:Phosphotransferase enzyme family